MLIESTPLFNSLIYSCHCLFVAGSDFYSVSVDGNLLLIVNVYVPFSVIYSDCSTRSIKP